MQGDDIRNHRMLAEKSAETASEMTRESELDRFIACFIASHGNLALWVIAEQLFEIRHAVESISISLEKGK